MAVALSGPGWFPRWVPTSDLELYQAEAAILNPIRPMISQKTVAGLNTICSIHEKVPSSELPVRDPAEEQIPSPPTSPVDAVASAKSGGFGSSSSFVPPSVEQVAKLRPLDKDKYTSIVFVHGYAGGIANWLPLWKSFAVDYDLYAFDLPGFARSPRPHVTFPTPESAIEFYVQHFEKWFEEMRIGLEPGETERSADRKIILVGHSFGGYLCSNLVMKYPRLFDHVVLADAWGVHRYNPPTAEEKARRRKLVSKTVRFLDWSLKGIYWGKLLRRCGPWALRILPRVRPEFTDTWSPYLDDPRHFYEYTYHCNVKKPFVGEAAFEALRTHHGPQACQLPLVERVALLPNCKAGANMDPSKAPRSGFKMTLLYGDVSWLIHKDLDLFVDRLRADNGIDVSYSVIETAGHMVMVDNVTQFTTQLLNRLKEELKGE